MKRALFFVTACMTIALSASSLALPTQTQDDKQLAIVIERIAKTSPEGLKILEMVQEMPPELNGVPSSKMLIEIVSGYAFNMGAYNLSPIGWEAYQKPLVTGEIVRRWRVVFHYRIYTQELLSAEWEYNEETNKLYPFEAQNAPQFWYHDDLVTRKKK